MAEIRITPTIALDESELEESFVLASGPGGQNVNKVSSAVQLRFNAALSLNLPEAVRFRLMQAAGNRLTKDGVIVIACQKFRDQVRNRSEAREILTEMIKAAAIEPKRRRKTRPSRAAKEKRLEGKKVRSKLKEHRSKPRGDGE
jgi:ribosome-associated protein